MAYDVPTLDTSTREKLLNTVRGLQDAGYSMDDIMRYFQTTQAAGRSSLNDYFRSAGDAIALRYVPQFDQARDTLGASPLLADSGYANRLNRQILTDLGSRMSADFGERAANQAASGTDYLRDLLSRRAQYAADLARQGYAGVQKKQKNSWAAPLAQIGGTVAGALIGGPPGAAIGSSLGGSFAGGSQLAPQIPSSGYGPMDQFQSQFYGPPNTVLRRAALNRDF